MLHVCLAGPVIVLWALIVKESDRRVLLLNAMAWSEGEWCLALEGLHSLSSRPANRAELLGLRLVAQAAVGNLTGRIV